MNQLITITLIQFEFDFKISNEPGRNLEKRKGIQTTKAEHETKRILSGESQP